MALAADSLLDRIRLKSQIGRWRALAILAAALFLITLLSPSIGSAPSLHRDMIARISIEDIILEDRDRSRILADITKNENIKAVLVYINSPGGTIVGGESLYKDLKTLAEKKPVVATLGGVAASGGYMAALPAHRIYAYEGTITGSIGVLLQTAEVTELAEKIGINLLTFKSGELKASPSPFEKLSQNSRKAVQSSVQSGFDMFLNMVIEGRNMERKKALTLADGRIYTGSQAVENGLIDAIGSETEALTWLHETYDLSSTLPVKDIELQPVETRFEKLLTTITSTSSVFSHVFSRSPGLSAMWLPSEM